MSITREVLKTHLLQLINRPGEVLHVHTKADPLTPCFKLRYMQTMGGMQFCFKIISYRGEGGGAYEPLERIEPFLDYAMEQIDESVQRFSIMKTKLNTDKDFQFELTFHKERTEPAPFAHSIDDDPNFADAFTIELSLPK